MNTLFTFEEISAVTKGKSTGSWNPSGMVNAVSTDTRAAMPGALFIALKGETFDAHNFLADAVKNGAALLCIEEGNEAKLPDGVPAVVVKSSVQAYQALAHAHRMRFPELKVIALTGSCGKTSTKEALRAIFEYAYGKEHVLATEGNTNNHIGVPRNLLKLNKEYKIAILEAGTSHHGEIEPLNRCIKPDHALVVSIRSSHIENLGSLEGIASEKSHIFDNLPADGGGVVPYACAGNDILRKAVSGHKMVTFGPENEADVQAVYLGGNLHGASLRLLNHLTGETAEVSWSIPGEHQASNAAGAAAMAYLYGIPLADAAKGLERTTLPGLRMRIAKHGSATWINDAYNANPDSMKATLSWLREFADEKHLVLILGDMVEQGEHSEEGHRNTLLFAKEKFPCARIITVGEEMAKTGVPVTANYTDSAEAAKNIAQWLRPDDLVLLKASRATKMEVIEPKEE